MVADGMSFNVEQTSSVFREPIAFYKLSGDGRVSAMPVRDIGHVCSAFANAISTLSQRDRYRGLLARCGLLNLEPSE
jgi:hypothetical protein